MAWWNCVCQGAFHSLPMHLNVDAEKNSCVWTQSNAHGKNVHTHTLTHLVSHICVTQCPSPLHCSLSLLCWRVNMSLSNLTSSDLRDNIRSAMSSMITVLPTTSRYSSRPSLNLPYCYPTWPHRCSKPKWTTVSKVDSNNHCRIAFNQRLKWGWLEASPHAD